MHRIGTLIIALVALYSILAGMDTMVRGVGTMETDADGMHLRIGGARLTLQADSCNVPAEAQVRPVSKLPNRPQPDRNVHTIEPV